MKTPIYAAITLGLSAVAANAGGLDRSGQWINDIFQTGSVAKFSYSSTTPKLSGAGTGNVGESFSVASGSYKTDVNDQVSLALIWDQPFGSSINYNTPAATTVLGGTKAQVSSNAVTAIARYKFDGGFSVHGGLRAQTIGGNLALSGAAFLRSERNPTGFNSYSLDLANDTSYGYVAVVAHKRPVIVLRVSLTFDHSFASS